MFNVKNQNMIRYTLVEEKHSTVFLRLEKPVWQYEPLEKLEKIMGAVHGTLVILDLSRVQQVTTAAFAQLIMVMQQVKKSGRNMVVRGLQEQPQQLCNILKLNNLLLSQSNPKE